MFFIGKIKKLEGKVAKAEQFEKSVSKIIENYFLTNEKTKKQYSIDGAIDKFYQFVMSVDERIKSVEAKNNEYVAKIAEQEKIIAEKNDTIEKMQDEINADNDELANKDEVIATQNAIIDKQKKDIKELSETKSALEIQLTAKKREMDRAKGGKK